ncbi:MAG TPA: hypothetical protein VF261_02185, partial [Candidatus Saccharimonadales bacterium]
MVVWKHILRPLILSLLIVLGSTAIVNAATCTTNPDQQSCSTDYGVSETHFGSGSVNGACSTTYCSDQTAGDLTVGKTCSTSFCAQTGSDTARNEYLQFVVNNTDIDLGVLSSGSTYVATATFSVEAYLASGYVVVNDSPPPVNGGHTLATPSVPTASAAGTEQFGINLVQNSCPANAPASGKGSCSGQLGANPSQAPDATFSFGKADDGTGNTPVTDRYDQSGKFMYKNGDTIAYSNS